MCSPTKTKYTDLSIITYPCIFAIRDHARKAGPPKKPSKSDLLILYLFKNYKGITQKILGHFQDNRKSKATTRVHFYVR